MRAHLSGTRSNLGANLLWVEVVIDKAVDDGGQLGLYECVASCLKVGKNCTKRLAQLFNKLDNLLLGGVAGQELVNVGHQVDADGASKGVFTLGNGGPRHEKTGRKENERDLHVDC